MDIKNIIVVLLSVTLIMMYSCQDDNTFTGESPDFTISLDTMLFDTVFTTVGSATRSFKIYNNESEDIEVSIQLANGSDSKFRINADGTPGSKVDDILIPGNDSIYVFADVTVDPDQPLSISPFIIEEDLIINSGMSEQQVLLTAYGQNANYIPTNKQTNRIYSLVCESGQIVWDDPKPYVIYGIMVIDECKLIIPEGTDVYIHGGIVRDDDLIFNSGLIAISETGTIEVNGTATNPVTFQGDRLEQSFDEVAGQWEGIRFLGGSKGNTMEHVQLKNSVIGIRVDSAAELTIKKSIIGNTSSVGIAGIHATINMENSLIYNNGQNGILLTYGGNYQFDHCTVASYGNQSSSLRMDNFRCTDPPLCQEVVYVNGLNAAFRNCILAGNEKDEITLLDWTGGSEPILFQYDFDHCIVKVEEILEPDLYPEFFNNCNDCLNMQFSDTLFLDQENNEFMLDTMSIAIDNGIFLPGVSESDLIDNNREDTPDLGCFELLK